MGLFGEHGKSGVRKNPLNEGQLFNENEDGPKTYLTG
jgi:hypothetical protein